MSDAPEDPRVVEGAPKLNDGWDEPQEVSDVDVAFPARGEELTPPWELIPEHLQLNWWIGRGNLWVDFMHRWFQHGDAFERYDVWPRPDVDPVKALRHLRVVLTTYATKHEHKIAGAAWLASRWYAHIEKREDPS